jgi:hypothetical protein
MESNNFCTVESIKRKGTMGEDSTSFDFLGVRSPAYLPISLNKTKKKKDNRSLNYKSKPQSGSVWGKRTKKTY